MQNNLLNKTILVLLVIISINQLAIGQGSSIQYAVVGPSSANQGETIEYTITPASAVYGANWSVGNNATIITSNPTSATILFNNTGKTIVNATVYDDNLNQYPASHQTVSVTEALYAGQISGTQLICKGVDPNEFTSTFSASGGNGIYTYQWEKSTTSAHSGYSEISGATSLTYNSPIVNSTTWFRRKVTSGTQIKYTSSVAVTFYTHVQPGSISGVQTVCYNGNPSTLNNEAAPTGGDSSSYTYKWQLSPNKTGSWTDISGATGSSYNPPSGLTSSKWYRRVVTSCGQTAYSNAIQVSVSPSLVKGVIGSDQNICYNSIPSTIENVTSPSGGDLNYIFQWEYSTNSGSNWSPISGAINLNFVPSTNITVNTWYRRKTTSCSQIVYSNTVKVTVKPALNGGGTISGSSNICYNSVPGTFSNNQLPSGGNGLYEYQWQRSDTGTGNWIDIENSNSASYIPYRLLFEDRYYRREVTSCNQIAYSNIILVEVEEEVLNPIVQDGIRCGAGSVELSASGDNLFWFENSTGGSQINNGLIFNTPSLANSQTYYVENRNDLGCTSDRIPVTANIKNILVWYLDADNDNFASLTQESCSSPGTGWTTNILPLTDCDDSDENINPNTVWYLDSDGDGYSISSVVSCDKPGINYYLNVIGTEDCNDQEYDTSNICDTVIDTDPNPTDKNYVYSRTYLKPTDELSNPNMPFFTSSEELIQEITYFDGLGRPIQKIGLEQSPELNYLKKDIVSYITYDDYGRMIQEWLPIAMSTGEFGKVKTGVETQVFSDYNTEKYEYTQNPYSEKHFEPSPLNRVLKQAAPGNDWVLNKNGDDHSIEFAYEANEANEVRLFNVNFINDNTEQPELAENNFYEVGQLYKNITRDENHSGTTKNHTTEEFTDKQGRVVLKRTYADVPGETQARHDTYYVYDDYGNLTFVLPPKMEATDAGLSTLISNMDALGYQYTYDHRNRLVEKQIPGKDEEFIVYNKLDQPILTQDANLRENGEWLFTKYDAFGRVAYTGIATLGSLATVKTDVENSNAPLWVSQTGTSTVFGGVTDGVFYTSNTYPESNTEILTINYYDNYDARPTSFPTSINILDSNPTKTNTTNVKDLPTVSKVKVLENDDWITSLSYYDEKGRAVYSYSENSYLGTVDIMETALDFVGKPLKTRTEHRRDLDPAVSGDEVVVVTIDNFTYDHVGRLLSQTQCIGDATMGTTCESTGVSTVQNNLSLTGAISTLQIAGQSITVTEATLTDGAHLKIDPNGGGSGGEEELIVFNDYDELGQLQAKKVGGSPGTDFNSTTGLQSVDYDYNVRGWLKGINDAANLGDDLFAFEMNYNTSEHGGVELFNGNIAETEWKTANDNQLRWYHYAYDPLNRLKAAVDYTGDSNYGMTALYDKNGNITELNRNGLVNDPNSDFGPMDRLSYEYDTGNKLLKVSDIGRKQYGFIDGDNTDNDYNYDPNGNMVSDKNKGMFVNNQDAITYNHLNLPVQIRVLGSPVSGIINYVYDATGVKLNKEVSGTSSGETEYAGNYIYKKLTNGSSELQFFSHPEGYVSYENGVYKYVYEYKDHLGNVRLTYADSDLNGAIDPNTEILSESNYYPFGLKHKGYNGNISSLGNSIAKKWKFQGVEFEEALDIDLYEMEFRNYDPAIGRFSSIDPLAEQRNWLTPYNFVQNNPIVRVDPSGLLDDYGIDQNGNVSLIKETDDKFDRLYSVTSDENGELVKDENGEVAKNDTNGDGKVNNRDSSGKIRDRSVLPELSEIKETTYDSYNGEKNLSDVTRGEGTQSDLFKIFNFAANNSSTEWSLYRLNIDGETQFNLGTFRNRTVSPGGSRFDESQRVAGIHSHPNIPSTNAEETGSMFGDRSRTFGQIDRNGQAPGLKYIYFPNSNNIYNINNTNGNTSYIRNTGGNYKRFFFGTLNTQ